VVCKTVVDRTIAREHEEVEEARFGKQIKQKPMNQIRREREEREYFLELAREDKKQLRQFIRLVDYVTVETLVKVNLSSMMLLFEEMKKEGRKSGGLFNSTVMFDSQTMVFSPDVREMQEALVNTLVEQIKVV